MLKKLHLGCFTRFSVYYTPCLEPDEKVYLIIEHLIEIERIVGQPVVLEVSISVGTIREHKVLISVSEHLNEET